MDLLSSQATNNDAGIPVKTCHAYTTYLLVIPDQLFLANFFFAITFYIDLEALRTLHSAHSKRGAYFCHTHGNSD